MISSDESLLLLPLLGAQTDNAAKSSGLGVGGTVGFSRGKV